jgi:hypothetical protein
MRQRLKKLELQAEEGNVGSMAKKWTVMVLVLPNPMGLNDSLVAATVLWQMDLKELLL